MNCSSIVNIKLKTGAEKRWFINEVYNLTNQQLAILKSVVDEVSSHHIEDKTYRELCLSVKQLHRDIATLSAAYMTSANRGSTLRRILGTEMVTIPELCDRCSRKAKQQLLEAEIYNTANALKILLDRGLEFSKKRVILSNAYKPVNTAVN